MRTMRIAISLSLGALVFGCAEQPGDTQETVDNLVRAGFPADDITVVGSTVYVGRDAEVSLAASREMLQAGGSGKEQYRTTNTVSTTLAKICVDGSTFTGVFSTALDLAIQNYDEQPLSFAMARAPSTGCNFTIRGVIQPGLVGGVSGFPSGGLPFPTINIGDGLSTFSVDTIEHIITHELGHTIGYRHSDFFNRSISCGTGGNEGDGGIGAILVPGTPSGATVGGSIMNACFRTFETGEFTASDLTALKALYGTLGNQAIINDVMSTPGWTSIVPMNINNDSFTDLLSYNSATGRAVYSVGTAGGGQTVVIDVMSTPGWTIIVPMNLNGDAITDLLTYNVTTGRAVYSVGSLGGGQTVVNDLIASPGWTSLVPMNINNDLLTDLLSYNATTGRAVYSVGTAGGGQAVIIDVMSTPGWTTIVPLNLNGDTVTDLLTYNVSTGRAVYSAGSLGGGQTVVIDVIAPAGWTSLVPLRLNNDGITDLLTYNIATGLAVYSIGNGGQVAVNSVAASPGWTALVPMSLNGDGFTDLLSYNRTTGRAVYSVTTIGN